jgi:Transposase DDE domain
MGIIAKVGAALQQLFGEIAEEAAQKSGVIVRKRKFTALSLARTFVLGFLRNPEASDEELARMAAECGAEVTPQAMDQRHSEKLVTFLQEVFYRAAKLVIGSDKALAPLLERFTKVNVLDSSTITLPDRMQQAFPGCGGSHGSGAAAMKLQMEIDLRSGALTVMVERGRSPDGATSRQHERLGAGALQIADLGYFNQRVFAERAKEGEYFLSRLQFGTSVVLADEDRAPEDVEVLKWLAQQPGPFVDQKILLGKEERVRCRLIAWRLPEEQAKERRRKLRCEYRRKYGKEPSAERLAWCDWTILVTNVPVEMLTPEEAVVLYRARWQVELLFKRWKSQDLVAVLRGSTVTRQMVGVWSRLLAALVQHWLLVGSVWGDATKSWSKVCEAVRDFAGRLAASLDRLSELECVITDLCAVLAKTCRRNKRSKPGTFELLNDVDLLDYSLT